MADFRNMEVLRPTKVIGQIKCLHCKKVVDSKCADKEFCGDRCRHAHRMFQRACPVCRTAFSTRNKKAICCSVACMQALIQTRKGNYKAAAARLSKRPKSPARMKAAEMQAEVNAYKNPFVGALTLTEKRDLGVRLEYIASYKASHAQSTPNSIYAPAEDKGH